MYKKVGISIILVCTLLVSMALPTFALDGSINSVSSTYQLYSNNGNLSFYIQSIALSPYSVDYSYSHDWEYNSSNNQISQYTDHITFAQNFIILIRASNTTDSDLFINTQTLKFNVDTVPVNSNYASDIIGTDIDITGNLANYVSYVTSNGVISLRWSTDYSYNGGIVIPSKSVLYSYLNVTQYYYFSNTSVSPHPTDSYGYKVSANGLSNPSSSDVSTISDFTLINSDYNSIITNETLDDIYNQLTQLYSRNHNDLVNINNSVQSILAAYTNNASNVTETQSNISNTDSTISSVHDQEQSFYVEHQSAIEEVGLSNFALGDPEVAGTTSVINDFTDLWSNIGPIQIIFTFSLTMSLASYLLKHKPFTKTSNYINRNSG